MWWAKRVFYGPLIRFQSFSERMSLTMNFIIASQLHPSLLRACAQSLQSCLTLCDPTDGSLLGSSVHSILLTRILKWVAMAPTWHGSN